MASCHRHGWEIAGATCDDCGLAFCWSCLFYVTKTQDAPVCVPCALAKAGVRKGREPRVTRRHQRALANARRKATKEYEKARAAQAAEQPALEGMTDGVEAVGQESWAALDSSTWDVRPA